MSNMADWDDAPTTNDCNDGDSQDAGGGRSFGKGRGFTPQGVDGNDNHRGRGGRGGRGGPRGGRDGGFRNRDRNGDDSWGGGGGNRDETDGWGNSEGGSSNRQGGYGGRRNDGEGGYRGRGGGRRNDDENGGGYRGGGRRDDESGGYRGGRRNDDGNDSWGGGGDDRRHGDDGGDGGWGGGGGGGGFGERDGERRGGGGRGGGRGGSRGDDGGFGGGRDNLTEDGKERPPIYVPKDITDDEINETGIGVGINFKDYDTIKVNVSGENAPKPINSFQEAGLRPLIIDNLKYFKYTDPTPIQKYAIPIIREGRDLMATAQTGSGKTAAFLLPIIHCLLEKSESDSSGGSSAAPKALILSPTRELTTQIFTEAKKFCRGGYLKVCQIYGGTAVSYQSKRLLDGCDILVATPGRLGDFLNRGFISLSDLRFFVLDEADRMLEMGFRADMENFFNHSSVSNRKERQTLMFSATFEQEIQRFAQQYLDNYVFLAVGIVGGACKDVEQTFIQSDKREKQKKLLDLLQNERTVKGTLLFVGTKRNADFIAAYLSEQDFPTTSIHGDRFQEQRETALREFRKGSKDILVATAVAARGLDIKGVKHVINYDLPKEIDEYVHRIGRTGRLGNKGKATSFYDRNEDSNLATSLVTILEQANQPVPDWLKQDATGVSGFNNAEFGGYDYRSKSDTFKTGAEPQPIQQDEEW